MHEDPKKTIPTAEEHLDKESENIEHDEQYEENPEKMEELKLRAKFPQAGRGPPSAFLQKRLQQRKFFDSGDYNMAKAKGLKLPVVAQKPLPMVPPVKQENLSVMVADETGGSTSPTGMEIPKPETIPQRKTSLVQPTASKLSPQPLLHHSPTNPPLTTFEDAIAE